MMTPIRFLVPFVMLSALAACGGGGGGAAPTVDPEIPVVEPDDDLVDPGTEDDGQNAPPADPSSDADDPVESFEEFGTDDPEEVETEGSVLSETVEGENQIVAGIGITRDPNTGERILVRVGGTYTDDTQVWTLDDRIVTLTDDVPGLFTFSDSFIDESETMTGIIGLPTDIAAMPVDGSASFTGGAVVSVILANDGVEFVDGTSTVTVDFADGSVSATLGDFTNAISLVTGKLAASPPLESLILTDATITGSGFSGGEVSTTGAQTLNQIIGGNKTILSEGQFFGQDEATVAPAEVGGLIYAEGNNGQIFGSFVAD